MRGCTRFVTAALLCGTAACSRPSTGPATLTGFPGATAVSAAAAGGPTSDAFFALYAAPAGVSCDDLDDEIGNAVTSHGPNILATFTFGLPGSGAPGEGDVGSAINQQLRGSSNFTNSGYDMEFYDASGCRLFADTGSITFAENDASGLGGSFEAHVDGFDCPSSYNVSGTFTAPYCGK